MNDLLSQITISNKLGNLRMIPKQEIQSLKAMNFDGNTEN